MSFAFAKNTPKNKAKPLFYCKKPQNLIEKPFRMPHYLQKGVGELLSVSHDLQNGVLKLMRKSHNLQNGVAEPLRITHDLLNNDGAFLA